MFRFHFGVNVYPWRSFPQPLMKFIVEKGAANNNILINVISSLYNTRYNTKGLRMGNNDERKRVELWYQYKENLVLRMCINKFFAQVRIRGKTWNYFKVNSGGQWDLLTSWWYAVVVCKSTIPPKFIIGGLVLFLRI